jgi:hypothetical protein
MWNRLEQPIGLPAGRLRRRALPIGALFPKANRPGEPAIVSRFVEKINRDGGDIDKKGFLSEPLC